MRSLLCLTLAYFCSLLCTQPLQAQSLVHRWAFENNFNDTSGSGNHGTATGGPTFVSGKFGQGVSIASPDGGVNLDGLSVANNLPLLGADSWSMNLWVKLDTPLETLEYLAGFGLDDGYDGDFDTAATRAFISFGGGGAGTPEDPLNNNYYFWGGAADVHSGVEYESDGQWHMYTITYNGTTMNMFKDATPVLVAPVSLVLADVTFSEVHVGNPSNWNSNFDGALDEFSIFNGVLSDGQIGGLFHNNDINQPVTLDPSFTVNRDTGAIVLTNDSSFAIDVLGYTIRSASGALNPMNWDTIEGRFDAPPGGDGSIDPNDDWTVLTNTNLAYSIELSEGVPGTDGGTIAIGKVVNFGNSWVANPNEDLAIDLLLDDGQGTIKTVLAQYSGNGGESYNVGDLDTDGDVDEDDWMEFRTAPNHSFTGLTVAEAYLGGDLDGDFDKDLDDFSRFVTAYDAENGAGAFAGLLAVPEPSSLALLALLAVVASVVKVRRFAICIVGAAALVCISPMPASAALWGYYQLNGDANESTGNNINLNLVGDAGFNGTVHPGLGVAGSFDGDGDAMIGSNFNQFTTNDATVVAWAYADNLDDDWDSIIKNWGQTVGGQFHLGLGNGAANTLQNHLVGNGPVTDTIDFPVGEWVHTAFVVNSAALEHRLYINGQLIATAAYSGTMGPGTATGLAIGAKPNDDGSAISAGAPGFWAGRIDDVGLYNEALTTEQIQQIYENGLDGIQLDGTTSPYISLEVDRSNGNVTLRNTTAGALAFNAYELSSESGALRPANWQDLAGNTGFPTGTGTGNGWEKDLASDEFQLLETWLTGNSNLNATTDILLGNIYGGGTEDIKFRYRTSIGAVIDSIVEYVGVAPDLLGDYNDDGKVDAADYTVWRDGGSPDSSQAGYELWKNNFGAGGGSGAASAVPEPSALWMIALAGLAIAQWSRVRSVVRS